MQPSAYRCDACEREYRFFDRNAAVYEAPAYLRVPQWPAWCLRCEALTAAEHLPTEAAIVAEVHALRRGDENYPYRLVTPFSQQYPDSRPDGLGYLDRLLYWRRRRVSPAHCLDCASTDLLFVPSGAQKNEPVRGLFNLAEEGNSGRLDSNPCPVAHLLCYSPFEVFLYGPDTTP